MTLSHFENGRDVTAYSVKCVALAHHALIGATSPWKQLSMLNSLCVIDSSQQTNATGSCVLFVKRISAWIIGRSEMRALLSVRGNMYARLQKGMVETLAHMQRCVMTSCP